MSVELDYSLAFLDNRYVLVGDEFVMPPVIDFYDPTDGLPTDPGVGDRYISDADAEGWEIDHIYEWDGETWVESEPSDGWMIWVMIEFMFYFFFSGAWTEAIDHGALRGLAHDDHPQYVNVAGDTMTGDLLFEGEGSGLAYGGMYQHETTTTVALTKDTWVKIDGFVSVGLLNNVSFVSDYALTVDAIGVYKVSWSINGDTVSGNKDLRFAVFCNDVEVEQGSGRTESKGADVHFHVAANLLLDITNTAHQVDMRIMNLTDDADMVVHGATFNLIQVGGT